MPKPFEPGKQYFCRDRLNCDIPFTFVGYYNDKAIFMPETSPAPRQPVIRMRDGSPQSNQGLDFPDRRYDVMPETDRVERFANIYPETIGAMQTSLRKCQTLADRDSLGILKVTYEDGLPISTEILDPAEIYKD